MAIPPIDRLSQALTDLIGNRPVALLDWPDYANAGDHFIWLGEKALLRRARAEVVFEAPSQSLDFEAIARLPADCALICHGGGNFGDLYPRHQEFREALVRRFRERRIVMMPQSVNFRSAERFAAACAIYGEHPDLHVFARDAASLQRLERLPASVRRALHIDSAFALRPFVEELRRASPALVRRRPRAEVRLMRRDEERSAATAELADAIDWSNVDDLAELAARAPPPDQFRLASGLFSSPLDRRSWPRFWAAFTVLNGASMLVSDRLHAHVLAQLMGLRARIVPDAYTKLRDFTATWGGPDRRRRV